METVTLAPHNIPKVSLDFMNRTHEEEVVIVNKLMKLLENNASAEAHEAEVSTQLILWLEHTEAHFARENELMQQVGFPAYPVHAGEHESALKGMQSIVDDWQANKDLDQLQDYVFKLWPDWFLAHVSTMDTVTANFAKMQGYNE